MKNQKTRIEKLTARVYGDLPPEERLLLVLKHVAKGNPEEAIRLTDACPVENYRMMDPVYANKFRAAYNLAVSVGQAILAKYMMMLDLVLRYETKCAVCCLMCPSENVGEGEVKTVPDLPPPSTECALAMRRILKAEATMNERAELLGAFNDRQTMFRLMKAELMGFDACCRDDLGIAGKTLLHAFVSPFFYEWFEAIEPTLESIELPEDYKEAVAACRKHYADVIALLLPCKGD